MAGLDGQERASNDTSNHHHDNDQNASQTSTIHRNGRESMT